MIIVIKSIYTIFNALFTQTIDVCCEKHGKDHAIAWRHFD
jgi:hypothetical protein